MQKTPIFCFGASRIRCSSSPATLCGTSRCNDDDIQSDFRDKGNNGVQGCDRGKRWRRGKKAQARRTKPRSELRGVEASGNVVSHMEFGQITRDIGIGEQRWGETSETCERCSKFLAEHGAYPLHRRGVQHDGPKSNARDLSDV